MSPILAPSSASTPARPSNRAGNGTPPLPPPITASIAKTFLTFTQFHRLPLAGKQHRSRATVSRQKIRLRSAVLLLPNWNAKWHGQNGLCHWIQRLGIAVLKMSMPYHGPPHGQGPRARRPVSVDPTSASPSRPTAKPFRTPAAASTGSNSRANQTRHPRTSIAPQSAISPSFTMKRISAGGFFHVSTYYATSSARE